MDPGLEMLKGEVEVDEAWVGGLEKNKHSDKKLRENWPQGKQVVLGMRERGGRIVVRPIPSNNRELVESDILLAIEKGATIYTDEFTGYKNLHQWYNHDSINHNKGEYVRENVTTNSIESVWAIVKRAYKGIHHQWSRKHGDRYYNEIAYRLTEGRTEIPIMFRIRRLAQRSFEVQLTYRELIGKLSPSIAPAKECRNND